MKKIIALSCLVACSAVQAQAETKTFSFDTEKFYAGGGLNYNRVDSSILGGKDGKATGYQAFAGYEYGQRNGFDIAGEVGLIQTEEFYNNSDIDANGIWAAAVATKALPEINEKLSAVARIGLGIKGDDGLFMGFGAQYQVKTNIFVRAEYLNKDLTQSYQVNAAYQF